MLASSTLSSSAIFVPRPGVSACFSTLTLTTSPSGVKPTIRLIAPPKPFFDIVSTA